LAARPVEIRQVRGCDPEHRLRAACGGPVHQHRGHGPEDLRLHEAAEGRVPRAGEDAVPPRHLVRGLQPEADDGNPGLREPDQRRRAPRHGFCEVEGPVQPLFVQAGQLRVAKDQHGVDADRVRTDSDYLRDGGLERVAALPGEARHEVKARLEAPFPAEGDGPADIIGRVSPFGLPEDGVVQ